MTIPYAGVCVGSGKSPREGSLRGGDGSPVTGICPVCSGRFELRHDLLPEHETAPEDEREASRKQERWRRAATIDGARSPPPAARTSMAPKTTARAQRGGD